MTITPQTIRQAISNHVNTAYSGALPIEWENMPPPANLAGGWVRLLISIDRIEKAGLNPGRKLIRGRIILLIAVAQGQGTAVLDQVAAEMVDLLSRREVSRVRTGAAIFSPPRREKGQHLLPIDIRFTAIETDL